MTAKFDIEEILEEYDKEKLSIATIGSHSALNILRGAKEEGFRTAVICKEKDAIVYERFPLADKIIIVNNFTELLNEKIQAELRSLNAILVPHGSFTAYLKTEDIEKQLRIPIFGNRQLLQWETSREKQRTWLQKAGLKLPKTFSSPEEIQGLAIVKFPGARGGKGYFLVDSPEKFWEKAREMVRRGLISEEDIRNVHLQEYIIGVNVYPHYFSSVIRNETEFFGVDRRYESNVDAIGKIPAGEQLRLDLPLTYTVVGNIPLTVRESLLPELIRMGDKVVEVSREIASPGIIGPFCLETVIDANLEIYTFEISARIVAGTNVGIGISPYAYIKYGAGMYMGRRIALEIKEALKRNKLKEVLT
ncbi:5-formaminoimidazole-4-carboxamide-1-(beta)-D-ribofuranosyl 5'-monophosphate synthetase [Candidatus Bathyarchaeota archaeon]|nr:MAG: 5-formaminoimidazole-4-carboxamide-1-(beta)-D-ribofuranosyl 5'-monophosphate synthetase [Candidatus Bathyarchaeota archaeon]